MFPFLARRLLQSLLSLALISIIVFVVMVSVSDPIAVLLPRSASQADRAALRHELGLDRPLTSQYVAFLSGVFHGDLGRSYYSRQPVASLIAERAPATIELAVLSLALSVLIGIPLGIAAGVKPNGWLARLTLAGSTLGISLPTFWLGLLLITYFGVHLGWLPTLGRGETRALGSAEWSFLTRNGWAHLVLPAATLSLHHVAMLVRLVQSEMMETLRLPFIRVARSRGLPERSIVGRHALRNTLIPIVTVVGVEFGQLLAFSVVTESIFQWPGLGKLLIDSIRKLDHPVVIAYLLLTGVLFLSINFLVDLTYALIDPRVRVASSKGVAH